MTIYKISFVELIQKIRKKFGDKNIYLWVAVYDKDGKIYSKTTVARDNIEDFFPWTLVMQAKLIMGEVVEAITVALQVAIPDKYEVIKEGKKVKISGADIYNFGCKEEITIGFTEEETFKTQNTDAKNPDNLFAPKPYVDYKSSEKLLEEFVK